MPLEITNAMVEAALAAWYPGEWPDDPNFHTIMTHGKYKGQPWGDQCFDEMHATLEAALAAAPAPQEHRS
jgi:hypothetical protein